MTPTGTASWDAKTGLLKITTRAKRGKKYVDHTSHYIVQDSQPDTRVANPAFRLAKVENVAEGELADPEWKPTGEVYHVAIEQFGPTCDCPHHTFRGSNSKVGCKHVLACQVVGLLPR